MSLFSWKSLSGVVPRVLRPAFVTLLMAVPALAHAAWDAAPTLLDSGAAVAGPPHVAIEPFGNAVTVWTQGTDVLSRTWNGASWTAEAAIDDLDTTPEDASVSLNAYGNGMAIWRQPVLGTLQVFAASYAGGTGTWSAPTQLSFLSSNALDPRVVLGNNSGGAMVVWRQNNGSETNLYASHWNGASWSAPVVVDNLTGNTNAPNVAMDNSGNAVALWEQFDGSADSVFSSIWNGTNWSIPTQIDGIAGFVDTPHLAMYNNQAVAVWQGFGGGEFNIYASRLPALIGAWTAPVVLDALVGSGYYPRVALASNGNAVAVWEQTNGGAQDLYSSRWDGSAWGAAETIQAAAATGVGILKPQVGIDSNGNAIVVYSAGGNATTSRRLAGGAWSTPQLLETAAAAVDNPQIAVNGTGHAVAVWQQNNNDYAMRYVLDATYTITPVASPVAGGTISCVPLVVSSGGSTVCTATANSGYRLTTITTTSAGSCNVSPCTVGLITANQTVTANFVLDPLINGACGTANGIPVASAPTTNLCAAGTPSTVAGSGPWNWSCIGSGGGSTASCSAPLAAAGPFAITVTASAGGTASCTPNPVASGGSATCTASAAPGFVFQGWTGDCTGMSCNPGNVAGPLAVHATFGLMAAPSSGVQSVPTLSEWGMITMLSLTGLIGMGALRKKP